MAEPSTDPAEIKVLPPEAAVAIVWSDGHRSLYPFNYLRSLCPCATCLDFRRSRDELKMMPTGMGNKSVTLVEHWDVGRYAVAFRWSDGHSTGIYSFDHLRRICPCDSCRSSAARDTDHARI